MVALSADKLWPILLAVSDGGPQMVSVTTREFMALHALTMHVGRPGTPTDKAHIESLRGHVKTEWPHPEQIRDPLELDAALAPASATSRPTKNTKDGDQPSAKPNGNDYAAHAPIASPTVNRTQPAGPDRGGTLLPRDAQSAHTHRTVTWEAAGLTAESSVFSDRATGRRWSAEPEVVPRILLVRTRGHPAT